MIIDAAKAEGERPSFDNLPPSGELISRIERMKTPVRKRRIGTVGSRSSRNWVGQPTRSCGFAIPERKTSYGRAVFASGLMANEDIRVARGHVARHVGKG